MFAYYALIVLTIVLVATAAIFLLTGFSVNGHPMRFDPTSSEGLSKASSWYIEGQAVEGVPVSCSFVEFDERGDFLDFGQHRHCGAKLGELADESNVLLVIYCHGWKNSSQSGDVVAFNAFLGRLAASEEIRKWGLRVHGVYLGWRGNAFRPYVDKTGKDKNYQQTVKIFGEPIVDAAHHRKSSLLGFIPENLSYWNRKLAAEHRASGLPIARAIFTYAAAVKGYGKHTGNRVLVMGHSFGALMLERSLGQAMTGAITMGWWGEEGGSISEFKRGLPFELILFVNSAAPALYAKELRDFLQANRAALQRTDNPLAFVPVILSITSTADWATGILHPLGNFLAPISPSLQRQYTVGIFGNKQKNGSYPPHPEIRQSDFYTTTPGHNKYLINHWIVKDGTIALPVDVSAAAVFRDNLSTETADPDVFITSEAKYPATAWRLSNKPRGQPVTLQKLPLSMQTSNYWIITCDKELIGGHNDIWSPITMELYAALFRAVQSRHRTS
jgi:pimeloyl-ACP methyl ester carboxylesterase